MRPFSLRPTALVCTTALASLSLPATATAQTVTFRDLLNLDRLATLAFQAGVTSLRGLAELRYEDLDLRPLDSQMTITGLEITPFEQDRYPGCTIRIERVSLVAASLLQTDITLADLEVTGARMPATCLDPSERETLIAFGVTEVFVDRVAIRAEYVNASAALSLDYAVHMQGHGIVTGAADFAYAAFNIDAEEPVFDLVSVEMEFVDDGLWAQIAPLAPPFLADAGVLEAMLTEALLPATGPATTVPPIAPPPAEGGKPGEAPVLPVPMPDAPQPEIEDSDQTATARAVITELAQALSGFAANPDRLAMTIRPEAPVRLTEDMFDDDFLRFASALPPRFENGPASPTQPTPEIAAALAAHLGGGGDATPPQTRRALATALIDGAGVPRNAALALEVLAPLLSTGDAEALALAMDHLDLLPPDRAYALLHGAAAAGNLRARAGLDRAERRLGLAGALAAQGPLDATTTGETPAGLGRLARIALEGGEGAGRHYRNAYFWALFAEAGGDLSARALVDEIEDRGRLTDDPALWNAMLAETREAVFDTWLTEVNRE